MTDAYFKDANGDRLNAVCAEIHALVVFVNKEVPHDETVASVIWIAPLATSNFQSLSH